MVFTVIISAILIFIAIALNQVMNSSFEFIKVHFPVHFFGRNSILTNSNDQVLKDFCPVFIEDLKSEYSLITTFQYFMIINTCGMFTQVVQKITTSRVKDNVALNVVQIALEASIAAVGILFLYTWSSSNNNTIISDTCGRVITISGVDKQ